MKKNARRGVTMAELCIAIAVISIVSTMVVSFSVLVAERNNSANAKLETITDINFIETMVEEWFEKSENNISYYQNETGIHISEATELDNVSKLGYSSTTDKVIYFTNHNTLRLNDREIELSSNIEGIKFSKAENSNLYYCTIEYETRGYNNGPETYTFCVNTKMGY